MRVRAVALLVVSMLLTVACGQKEGVVNVAFDESGALAAAPDGGAADGQDDADLSDGALEDDRGSEASQEAGADGTAGTRATGTDGEGATSGTSDTADTGGSPDRTAGGGDGAASEGGNSGPSGAPEDGAQTAAAEGEGDSTGITDDEIVIGFHAPLTGAAPLPQRSFVEGQTQYWEHRGQVYGRNIRIIIKDDRYNPSHATQICKEMIQRDRAFILGGAGGADQIAACARVAAAAGVPYLSPGVDEGLLRNLRNYFAFSMSYPQQAPLVVQWVAKNSPPSNNRFGIIKDRTPSFQAVVEVMKAEAEKRGWEVLVRQAQNGPSDAQWLVQHQIEVAFPIMSPSTWVQIVNSPGGAIKQWVGIGITMGLNTVANAACPAIDGAMFFSPFPGYNTAKQLDPDTTAEDDIQWALWGSNKLLDTIFTKMDGVLTRERFVQVLENEVIDNGIYPVTRHTRDNHFTANQVHVLRADCSQRQYVTPPDGLFQTGF